MVRRSLRDALEMGASRWDAIVGAAPEPSPFMGWAWHRAWDAAALPAERRESVVLLLYGDGGDDAAPRAILPIAAQRQMFRRVPVRALTWASALVACPDHLDIAAPPDTPMEAFVSPLESMRWDIIVFRDVAERAPGVERLADALARRGHHVTRTPLHTCPFLDLPSSWDAYLASLSPSRRQTIRRKERKLEREHAATFSTYPPGDIEQGWRHLLSLHEQRWAGAGAFGHPQVLPVLRGFREALDAGGDGEFWLTTLDLAGEPAAVWCGFAWDNTVYFYQGGRDPRWESQSVGLVLMAHMIRRAIEGGYRRFDFMRGDEEYKRSWTSTARNTYEIVVYRRGWRGARLRALDWVRRARHRMRSRDSAAR